MIWLNLVELSRLDTFTQLLDKVYVLKKDRRERERERERERGNGWNG